MNTLREKFAGKALCGWVIWVVVAASLVAAGIAMRVCGGISAAGGVAHAQLLEFPCLGSWQDNGWEAAAVVLNNVGLPHGRNNPAVAKAVVHEELPRLVRCVCIVLLHNTPHSVQPTLLLERVLSPSIPQQTALAARAAQDNPSQPHVNASVCVCEWRRDRERRET